MKHWHSSIRRELAAVSSIAGESVLFLGVLAIGCGAVALLLHAG